ncbi:AraC family transcriptional regulator [Streptomyces sp. RerS4]|uniref:helix-turn-helix transcriptional regulator n=1 Tax=Streptomyces sp. RerS4 TaxID=2942449 RepID=UPI00201C2FE8|nr:AraC family transcriptional regulator [Streptomyces sp. RerS4]UQW99533.1 AraC family transcriptional regulator [Streptomyces sp. RerS4]
MSTPRRGDLPLHRLDVPLPHLLPFAIGSFDDIGPLSRADFPHRHAFYEILHITGGRGSHVLDLTDRPLDPPHLCVITPGQVHHWQDAEGLTGHVILFNEDFLLTHPEDAAALERLAERPWLRLRDRHDDIAHVLDAMEREYRALREGYAGVLNAYLHILIVLALRACDDAPGTERAPASGGRAVDVAGAFTRLIAAPGAAARSVAAAAKELGVSSGHLHVLVKEATGQTPGRLIRRRQTLEAKRLLARTDLTIRQVARDTGFADPAYFSRFFRRETGLSPGEYRAAVTARPGRVAGEKHHDPTLESLATARTPTVG